MNIAHFRTVKYLYILYSELILSCSLLSHKQNASMGLNLIGTPRPTVNKTALRVALSIDFPQLEPQHLGGLEVQQD